MTIDKSLKGKGRLVRSRNVLKRDERIATLKEQEKWTETQGPFNLPKVRVLKLATGKKKKKKAEEGEGDAKAPAAAAPAKKK